MYNISLYVCIFNGEFLINNSHKLIKEKESHQNKIELDTFS